MPKVAHYGEGIGIVSVSASSKEIWIKYDPGIAAKLEGPANKLIVRSTPHAAELKASLDKVIGELITLWKAEYVGKRGRKPGSGLSDVRTAVTLLIDAAPTVRALSSREIVAKPEIAHATPVADAVDGSRVVATKLEVYKRLKVYEVNDRHLTRKIFRFVHFRVPIVVTLMQYNDGLMAYRYLLANGTPLDTGVHKDARHALNELAEQFNAEHHILSADHTNLNDNDAELAWLFGFIDTVPDSYGYTVDSEVTLDSIEDDEDDD